MRRRIAAITLAFLLAACESMSPYEKAWQAMHLVDVAQTIEGAASDPFCHSEGNPVTRRLIGRHPHRDEVIAWGVAIGVVHYFAFRWIDNSEWPEGIKIALRSIDLVDKGITIGRNYDQGIRIFGDNEPCAHPFRMPQAQPVK